jgi:hypothetical protein
MFDVLVCKTLDVKVISQLKVTWVTWVSCEVALTLEKFEAPPKKPGNQVTFNW